MQLGFMEAGVSRAGPSALLSGLGEQLLVATSRKCIPSALPSHYVLGRALLSCLVHLNAASESNGKTVSTTNHLGGALWLARAVMFTGAALSGIAHRCFIRSDPGLMWGTTGRPAATAAVNRLPCSASGT